MGALGLVSAGVAGSPVAEQWELMQFWVQRKLALSLGFKRRPLLGAQMTELLLW